MKRKGIASLLMGAAAVAALASPAHAVVAAAVPGSFQTTYGTPVVVTTSGGTITFANGDIQPHDFVAFEHYLAKKDAKSFEWCAKFPKTKCPIFWSEVAAAGQTATVQGLENVEGGQQYTFFCSVHPRMQGTLVVGA